MASGRLAGEIGATPHPSASPTPSPPSGRRGAKQCRPRSNTHAPHLMFMKISSATRGVILVRIARTAAEMGVATVAVFSEDDAASLHVGAADEAVALKGAGVAAYLDGAQ